MGDLGIWLGKQLWVQLGFVGLFSLTGWAMWWVAERRNKALIEQTAATIKELRIMHEKEHQEWRQDSKERSDSVIGALKDNTRTLTIIAERVK